MNKIYIFSGLGVDKRAFQKINFEGLDIEFIDWIQPLKHENLKKYAERISKKLNTSFPVLIGLSFGGMLAVEIAKILPVKKVILIASAKTKNELPGIYLMAGKLGLNKIIPNSLYKLSSPITNWLFGANGKFEKQLLKKFIKNTDPVFLKWAINEIINWENDIAPDNCIHIHGNNDKIIPIKNIKADYIIENGGHFMTINKAKKVETLIKQICKS